MIKNRIKKNKHLIHAGERYSVELTPAAIALVGDWHSATVIDTFTRFSIALGGPGAFGEAIRYWADSSRIGSIGLSIEASIWWNVGAAQAAQEGSES